MLETNKFTTMANRLTDQQLIISELENKLSKLKSLIRQERFACLKYESNGRNKKDKSDRYSLRYRIDQILKEIDSKQLNIDL